jgi:cell division protein FtsZ
MTVLDAKKPIELHEIKPKICVIGVGGAGGNAVNNMIRSKLQGVEFVICNTDAQHMSQALVQENNRIQLGPDVTQGLGAGSRPEVGRAAAEESLEDVIRHIRGSNMIFITAGMGGGTGTGAAPVIAQAARELGILTVGVVTKPFQFEGSHRMRSAEAGIVEMEQYVDTLIIIPNQNLFRIANEKTTFADAFCMADDVLYSGVRGVTDLMIMPGLINLDFADIRAVMTEMGKAMMGTGEASGEGRAIAAAEAAISNPLLDDVSMKGARGVLINITGGMDMTLFEVDEAANRIREEIDPEASVNTNIIFGSTFDESMNGIMRVSVVATGIDAESLKNRTALNLSVTVEETPKPSEEATPILSTETEDLEYPKVSFPADKDEAYGSRNDGYIPSSREEYYGDKAHIQQPRRSLFGRFVDTVRGQKPLESSSKPSHEGYGPQSEAYEYDRLRTTPDDRTVERPTPTGPTATGNKTPDVHDIPAFLRRRG